MNTIICYTRIEMLEDMIRFYFDKEINEMYFELHAWLQISSNDNNQIIFSLSCLAQPVLRDKMGINAYYNFNSDLML